MRMNPPKVPAPCLGKAVQPKAASAPRTLAVPAPCGGNVGAVQPKAVAVPRAPAVPAPCGGKVGTVQPKAAAVPRAPAVPAPCGGHVGAAQPKAAAVPRAPAVPAPCGGNVGTVQPKTAAVPRSPVIPGPGGRPGTTAPSPGRPPQARADTLQRATPPNHGRTAARHLGRTVQRVKIPNKIPGQYPSPKDKTKLALSGVQTELADGTYNYVAIDGTIYISRTGGHPMLASGGEVDYAGMLLIRDGELAAWNNHSGHYQPSQDLNAQAGLPLELFHTWQEWQENGWPSRHQLIVTPREEIDISRFQGIPLLPPEERSDPSPRGRSKWQDCCVIL